MATWVWSPRTHVRKSTVVAYAYVPLIWRQQKGHSWTSWTGDNLFILYPACGILLLVIENELRFLRAQLVILEWALRHSMEREFTTILVSGAFPLEKQMPEWRTWCTWLFKARGCSRAVFLRPLPMLKTQTQAYWLVGRLMFIKTPFAETMVVGQG